MLSTHMRFGLPSCFSTITYTRSSSPPFALHSDPSIIKYEKSYSRLSFKNLALRELNSVSETSRFKENTGEGGDNIRTAIVMLEYHTVQITK
jgi:hypothetical protein